MKRHRPRPTPAPSGDGNSRQNSGPPRDALTAALEELSRQARKRIESHPWGHLLETQRDALHLDWSLPLDGRGDSITKAREAFQHSVDNALQALITHRSVAQPGRVYCLRCASADCAHSRPLDPRQIFAGYGSTGIPRFEDFGQYLLARQDPEVEALYTTPSRFLTRVVAGQELMRDLIEAYHDPHSGYRLHGQVMAGWYSLPAADGTLGSVGVTFQALSSRGGGKQQRRRRMTLNVVVANLGDESLEQLYTRLGRLPWGSALRWAQKALDSLGARRKRLSASRLDERVEAILAGLARRLERTRRARSRRTEHAQQRHLQGDRPTPMALRDLHRAGRQDILYDTRRQTLVVLGERGRAHVFNQEGKLVTSVRYTQPAIERRRNTGHWRLASAEEMALLEKVLGSLGAGGTLRQEADS
ncbi:MAG: hypothetical protein AAGD01_15370 [Acidobacteriota bacterium]